MNRLKDRLQELVATSRITKWSTGSTITPIVSVDPGLSIEFVRPIGVVSTRTQRYELASDSLRTRRTEST